MLETNAAKFKSYELLILSTLLPANPEAVCTLITYDKTVMKIMADLQSYVLSLTKYMHEND